MRDLSVDFRLVRLALASAQHGSFRQAAIALNVQQSSVSKAVRALEHRVGAELFERSHTGIRPTLTGSRFLAEAAQGFDYLERAIERIGRARRQENGEVRVVTSVPLRLLGHHLERFRREHNGVSVEVVQDSHEEGAVLVRRRKADLAIVTKVPSDETVRSMHLRDERMLVAIPKSHRLAKARSLAVAELRSEHFLLSSDGLGQELNDYLREQLPEGANDLSVQFCRIGQCDLVCMVACGFGLTIVLGNSIGAVADDLAIVPLIGRAKLPIHAVWMEANPNPALKSFFGHPAAGEIQWDSWQKLAREKLDLLTYR